MILAHRSWGKPAGPLALLVHGGAGSSSTWNQLGPWLGERGWQVVAVDLQGHGDSPLDTADGYPTFEMLAQDLVDTVAALPGAGNGVDLLLGASLGASVSLVCAAAHPTFAGRLALLDPPGRENIDRDQSAAEKRQMFADPEGFVRDFYRHQADVSESMIAAVTESVEAADQGYLFARLKMAKGLDSVGLAARCDLPVLALLGRDKDTPLGHEGSIIDDLRQYSMMIGDERVRFAAALRHGDVVALEAGHDLHNTSAFPATSAALLDWLSRTPPGIPSADVSGQVDELSPADRP